MRRKDCNYWRFYQRLLLYHAVRLNSGFGPFPIRDEFEPKWNVTIGFSNSLPGCFPVLCVSGLFPKAYLLQA